jgi:transcription initiation factor IIE alpha subunit
MCDRTTPNRRMNMNYTIQMTYDQVDAIIIQELTTILQGLKDDRKKRKNDEGMAIFDIDKKIDLKKLKEHIKSVELILKYYGVKEDDII